MYYRIIKIFKQIDHKSNSKNKYYEVLLILYHGVGFWEKLIEIESMQFKFTIKNGNNNPLT